MNYYIFLDISPLRGEISKSHVFVHTKIRDIKIDFKIKNVALVKVPIWQKSVVMGGVYKIIKGHFLLTRGYRIIAKGDWLKFKDLFLKMK